MRANASPLRKIALAFAVVPASRHDLKLSSRFGVGCKDTAIPKSGKAELSARVTLIKTLDRRSSTSDEVQARKLDTLLKPAICVQCDASQVTRNSLDRLR